MGLQKWILRRGIRGIVKSMCSSYERAKAENPDMDEGQLCQSVVNKRYELISPSSKEKDIIARGIDDVDDIPRACFLVFWAETGISPINNRKTVEIAMDLIYEEVERLVLEE
jgi:hypothetical protein